MKVSGNWKIDKIQQSAYWESCQTAYMMAESDANLLEPQNVTGDKLHIQSHQFCTEYMFPH